MNPKHLCMVALLAATPAFGQGNFLYTWHGDKGVFQVSFQVTPDENSPGASFHTATFTASIQAVSPDATFSYLWPRDVAGGSFGPPLDISITLENPHSQRWLTASAYQGWALVSESDTSTTAQLYWENGYWSVAQIPEPQVARILLSAAIAEVFLFRRRRRRPL
jgi:hypothetical protein